MTNPPLYETTEQAALERQKHDELEEIFQALLTIRRSSGWGTITLTLQGGDLTDIETAVRRKRKVKKDV